MVRKGASPSRMFPVLGGPLMKALPHPFGADLRPVRLATRIAPGPLSRAMTSMSSCCALYPCSISCFSSSFHSHILASCCIAPSLLESSILPLSRRRTVASRRRDLRPFHAQHNEHRCGPLGHGGFRAEMLTGLQSFWFVPLFGIAITAASIWCRYEQIARILKWLALALMAYVLTGFIINPDWSGLKTNLT